MQSNRLLAYLAAFHALTQAELYSIQSHVRCAIDRLTQRHPEEVHEHFTDALERVAYIRRQCDLVLMVSEPTEGKPHLFTEGK